MNLTYGVYKRMPFIIIIIAFMDYTVWVMLVRFGS
jgi:hypothetical protein